MAFMVASATGLSDLEMEDLLSLDDVVLDHLFRHYHPPLRRAPSIVWLKVPTPLLPFSCPFQFRRSWRVRVSFRSEHRAHTSEA